MGNGERQRVAIIGAGIAGLGAAWRLCRPTVDPTTGEPGAPAFDVTLFRATPDWEEDKTPHLGGHARTVSVDDAGTKVAVDMGVIITNPWIYPNLHDTIDLVSRELERDIATAADPNEKATLQAMLAGLETRALAVDLAVDIHDAGGRRVWATRRDRQGPLSQFPRFAAECTRFETLCERISNEPPESGAEPLGERLTREGFSDEFRNELLAPLLSLILVNHSDLMEVPCDFAAVLFRKAAISFFAPATYRTMVGGMNALCDVLAHRVPRPIRPAARGVRRISGDDEPPRLEVTWDEDGRRQSAVFDRVVMACGVPMAKSLLADEVSNRDARNAVLSKFRHEWVKAFLHRDRAILGEGPHDTFGEYRLHDPEGKAGPTLAGVMTYNLGHALGGRAGEPLFLSLYPCGNPHRGADVALAVVGIPAPAGGEIITSRVWAHEIMTRESLVARYELAALQGLDGIYYAGSYTTFSAHEDAFISGLAVAERLGAGYPFGHHPFTAARYEDWRDVMFPPTPAKQWKPDPAPRPASPSWTVEADVVVVGGGLSGLVAARRVQAEGRSVVVLEARHRPGGRMKTVTHLGAHMDAGAAFVGPEHTRLHALLKEIDVGVYDAHHDGDHAFLDGANVPHPYRGFIPPIEKGRPRLRAPMLAMFDRAHARAIFGHLLAGQPAPADPTGPAQAFLKELNRLSATIAWPYATDAERALDGQSVKEFRDAVLGDTKDGPMGQLVDLLIRAIFSVEPDELSMLWLLHYVKTAGGIENLAVGAQAQRIEGGVERIVHALVEKLAVGTIALGAPVDAVEVGDAQVTVRAPGVTARAKRVIVALPPTLAGQIAYSGAGAEAFEARKALTGELAMGRTLKFFAVFPTAFWRDERWSDGIDGWSGSMDGWSGSMVTFGQPATSTFDVSPPSGRPGVLVGFQTGQFIAARPTADEMQARKDAILAQLSPWLGRATHGAMPTPLFFFEAPWGSEPYTGGSATTVGKPGVLGKHGAHLLRDPVGPVHWAGSEVADAWPCYMEGAVRAGEAAAAAVVASLGAG